MLLATKEEHSRGFSMLEHSRRSVQATKAEGARGSLLPLSEWIQDLLAVFQFSCPSVRLFIRPEAHRRRISRFGLTKNVWRSKKNPFFKSGF